MSLAAAAPAAGIVPAVDGSAHNRHGPVTDTCAFPRYRRPRGRRVWFPTQGGGLPEIGAEVAPR